MAVKFRHLVPSDENPHPIFDLKNICHMDAYDWGNASMEHPFIQKLLKTWYGNLAEPFYGITSDGNKIQDLYHLNLDEDQGAPVKDMVNAAENVLSIASESEKEKLRWEIDSDVWRKWANPEMYVHRNGVRLEEVSKELVDAIFALLRTSLSEKGYNNVLGFLHMNDFLGKIVNVTKIMNFHSYNFNLFGTPSLDKPWGFHLYGHHLCINIFVIKCQMVISPVFMGAEPDIIDEGEHKGLRLLDGQENSTNKLMNSLETPLRDKAQVFKSNLPEDLPDHLFHPNDERHLAGASRDNRVIPYTGLCLSECSQDQKSLALEAISSFLSYLPEKALEFKMKSIEQYIDQTWLTWYGGYDCDATWYCRIQSPVILVELDHQSGVWLTNRRPERCHIHTIVRTPNGNDYGMEFLKQFKGVSSSS